MKLIGQYDSSYVRRVAIAMRLYGMAFEHLPWSVFGDVERIRQINPLTRVPTLVLDDGTALTDTHLILDHVDGQVAPDRRLFPQQDPERCQALRIAGLASGIADKAVSLFYEIRLHESASPVWVARCEQQIAGALALLETERAALRTRWWFGDVPGHADIAVACVLRHARESLQHRVRLNSLPELAAHCSACEALPVFQEISQPFIPPT